MRRALLVVVGSLLAGGCTWFKDRETIRSLITEATLRLDARRSVLGPVEIHGDEIDLLGGRLKLVVRVPHEDEGGDRTAVHVHGPISASSVLSASQSPIRGLGRSAFRNNSGT